MDCPFCGHSDTQVKDSRPSEEGGAIRRRRMCSGCHARFTTFERVQLRELMVVKRNGKRTVFDRDKLERSFMIALRKRDIDPDVIARTINELVRMLESRGESEATTQFIGEMVMKSLHRLDKVAYIRYASVYRDFRDASDFGDFVEQELQD